MCAIRQFDPAKGRVGGALNLPVSIRNIEIMSNYALGGGGYSKQSPRVSHHIRSRFVLLGRARCPWRAVSGVLSVGVALRAPFQEAI